MQDSIDKPDEVIVGAVGPIPIIERDDPRFIDEFARREANAALADAMHTPEELQNGLRHSDPDVRRRTVPRLAARGSEHPDTLDSLLYALKADPSSSVRDAVALALRDFHDPRVTAALKVALFDKDEDVRESACYSLRQLDVGGHDIC